MQWCTVYVSINMVSYLGGLGMEYGDVYDSVFKSALTELGAFKPDKRKCSGKHTGYRYSHIKHQPLSLGCLLPNKEFLLTADNADNPV